MNKTLTTELSSGAEIAATYNAFMSYSHAADARFAPFLQRAIQGFAKPWYKLRSVRIFRDETGLTLTPELWPDIQKAMNSCQFFILLASPEAAGSTWVSKEIEHWLSLKRVAPLIVVTSGKIEWNRESADFDWSKTTAAPRVLSGAYTEEPLYLDATEIRSDQLSNRHTKIRSAAAQIYARLTHRSLDDVIGADVRQHRRNTVIAGAAVMAFATMGTMYLMQRAETRRQETIATTRRRLDLAKSLALESLSRNGGPGAVNISASDAGRAAMLAVESISVMPTLEGNDALYAHLAVTPSLDGERVLPPNVDMAALSRDGNLVAVRFKDGRMSILQTTGSEPGMPIQAVVEAKRMILTDSGKLFGVPIGKLTELQNGTTSETSVPDGAELQVSSGGLYYATALKASGDSEATVAIFRTGESRELWRWSVGRPMSLPLAFSNNGKFLAFVDEGKVAVADVATGVVRKTGTTELVEITALAVDDSGEAVVVFGWEPDPRIIVKKNFVVRSFPTTGSSTFRPFYYRGDSILNIRDLAIDMKSGLVAVGGGPPGWIKVFDSYSTRVVAVIRDDDMVDWTMAPAGQTAAVVMASPAHVERHLIRRESGEAAAAPVVVEADVGPHAAVSRNGDKVAVAGTRRDRTLFLAVVDLISGKHIFDRNLPAPAARLLLSPTAAYVAVWTNEATAQVISLSSGDVVWTATGNTSTEDEAQMLYLTFSPDDRYLAWGRSAEGVFIEDLSLHQSKRVSSPLEGLLAVAVSPKGRAAAWSFAPIEPSDNASDTTGKVSVQVAGGEGVETLSSFVAERINGRVEASLAFDPTGERLAAGVSRGLFRVLDLRSKRAVISFFNEGELDSIDFNDDGQYLLTTGTGRLVNGSEQPEAAVWSLADGRRVWRSLTTDWINGFGMSPKAGPVVIAQIKSLRGTGYLGIVADRLYWQAPDLIRIACGRIRYRPSPEELRDLSPDLGAAPCQAVPNTAGRQMKEVMK